GDPGAKQLKAVNELLHKASQLIAAATTPGFLEFWDGSAGNFMRQYAAPTVDSVAPTPVFTFNSQNAIGPPNAFYGNRWWLSFIQSINGSTTAGSNAVVNKGSGTSFTYTN